MRCFRLSWVCSWDCACLRSSAKKWLYRDFAVALAILVVYAVNRFLLKPVMPNHAIGYFLKCHFNDFLGGILFPIYVNILIGIYLGKENQMAHVMEFVCLGILCALFWEAIAPILLPYSTADILDCIAYLAGSITCWKLYKYMDSKK